MGIPLDMSLEKIKSIPPWNYKKLDELFISVCNYWESTKTDTTTKTITIYLISKTYLVADKLGIN